ncbi:MAG: hypothetical protein M1825_002064 [Sarcosagium campestre]|nr:MAG: hypothetical protein M1825_002064 [Sarcosagium campestre]
MQSGILASKELIDAFNDLVSSTDQRGLLAGIKGESLVPLDSIPSTSADFEGDLAVLEAKLKDNEAAYVILRRYPEQDGFVAVTYVPDTAPVRSKMLFASSRLTLVRQLGTERFRDTFFATTKGELTADGFKRHDKHGQTAVPLTEEEQTNVEIRAAEAEASQGTSARQGLVVGNRVKIPITDDSLEALKQLPTSKTNLVQLKVNTATEETELVSTSSTSANELQNVISPTEPRFTFFRYDHSHESQQEAPILFISTCPSGSQIKERMIFASARNFMIQIAQSAAGLTIARKLEAGDPAEIVEATVHLGFHPKQEEKKAFSRPKRPGRN